jgi:hypothetical protein
MHIEPINLGENPANGSITAADENPERIKVPKEPQAELWS